MLEQGGMKMITKRNAMKAGMLYQFIESSRGFYQCAVKNASMRSRMNVPLRICCKRVNELFPDETAEKEFLRQAEERKLVQLA
jgi:phosphoserine aminotransferase